MSFIFWLGIFFTLSAPIVIGIYFDNPSISWVAALCGAFVTLMAKAESLAELSLGPVKAKMKEKLQEASATIEELRKIATATSEASLTELMSGSFMGGMNLQKRLELHDKVIKSLKEVGVTDTQIGEAEGDWRKGIAIIYHRAITKNIKQVADVNTINQNASENQKNAAEELQALLDFDNWAVPTPHQIKVVLKSHKIDSQEAENWLNDYEHFLKTNEIKNREQFVKQ